MDDNAKHLTDLLKQKISNNETVDIADLINGLEKRGLSPEGVICQILNETTSQNLLYQGIMGMRTLANLGRLSPEKIGVYLEKSTLLADTDELYKSIEVVSRSQKTAPALLVFVEERLLGEKVIADWRWFAFTAVASVIQNKSAEIPTALINKLQNETQKERDQQRKHQFQSLLYHIESTTEIEQILQTGKVDGVSIRDEFWRESLCFEKDPQNPSLVSTLIALNAMREVDKEEVNKFLSEHCWFGQQRKPNATKELWKDYLDDFVSGHLDRDAGGFRYHKNSDASIFGTVWATTSVAWVWDLLHWEPQKAQGCINFTSTQKARIALSRFIQSTLVSRNEVQKIVAGIIGFTEKCLVEKEGKTRAFADYPNGKPTITATDGAIQMLATYGVWDNEGDFRRVDEKAFKPLKNLEHFYTIADSVVDFVEACIKTGKKGNPGLANHPDEEWPQSDSTRYGLRILHTLMNIAENHKNETETGKLIEKIGKIFKRRSEIAHFLLDCKEGDGFAKYEGEKPSIIYTDLVLRCFWEHIWEKNPQKVDKAVLPYSELLLVLEKYINTGILGFVPYSPQNIFAIRSTTSVISLLDDIYKDEVKKDQTELGKLKKKLQKAISQHRVGRTPLFAAYRHGYSTEDIKQDSV